MEVFTKESGKKEYNMAMVKCSFQTEQSRKDILSSTFTKDQRIKNLLLLKQM